MRVSDIRRSEVEDGVEWSARVSYADHEHVLRFGGPPDLVGEADASMFLAATLLPAMAWQHDLQIDGPVSPLLASRVDRIARMYHAMDPSLRVPVVEVAEERVPVSNGDAVGAFFSRGIDSTYSALVPRTEPGPIEQLVYCRSLEPVHDAENRSRELERSTEVASRLGLPLLVIWTDLRTFTDPMLGWSAMHGAGLSAMALLVGQAHRAVVVPSAYDIAFQPPCGSHPSLDPLFSTEAVTVFHDHVDRSRQEKVRWLVEHRPEALDRIKVCYSDNRIDNCGRCHKCLLTMAGLRAEEPCTSPRSSPPSSISTPCAPSGSPGSASGPSGCRSSSGPKHEATGTWRTPCGTCSTRVRCRRCGSWPIWCASPAAASTASARACSSGSTAPSPTPPSPCCDTAR
ncbi:hypothetical protein ACE2AJ_00020 [Aquihabitans daechungensis]|uniref:hypothetical protein n=1 Tax=Aquihabitans daechungensis TaxID=1052257 RepID=UPI003BA05AF1